jgi:flavin-dependent dehydrogenase
VRFQQIGPLTRISKERDQWTVATASDEFHARFLIGADGANSQVRKLARLAPEVKFGIALETTIPAEDPSNFPMTMDYAVVPQGYAWIFPKHNHISVGLYTLQFKMKEPRATLAVYCQTRTSLAPGSEVHGHPIPYNGVKFRHVPGSPMLVGDAAGLIDPLLGEGIYNAIRSGQIAAESVLDMTRGRGDTYGKKIREITSDLWWYGHHTRKFYEDPDFGYRHLTRAPVRYLLMKGMSLGWTYKKMQFWSPFLPFAKPNHDLIRGPDFERTREHPRSLNPS